MLMQCLVEKKNFCQFKEPLFTGSYISLTQWRDIMSSVARNDELIFKNHQEQEKLKISSICEGLDGQIKLVDTELCLISHNAFCGNILKSQVIQVALQASKLEVFSKTNAKNLVKPMVQI